MNVLPWIRCPCLCSLYGKVDRIETDWHYWPCEISGFFPACHSRPSGKNGLPIREPVLHSISEWIGRLPISRIDPVPWNWRLKLAHWEIHWPVFEWRWRFFPILGLDRRILCSEKGSRKVFKLGASYEKLSIF